VGWNYVVAARVNPHGMIEMLSKLKQYDDRKMGVILSGRV